MMAWTPFKNALTSTRSTTNENAAPVAGGKHVVPSRATASDPAPLALDAIGQRNEMVRQRIDAMRDRLEDMRSLQDDFSSILEPLAQISDELPRASMRIAELDAALSQERQAATTMRREAEEVSRRLGIMSSELGDALSRADKAEAEAREREQAEAEKAIALRDKTVAIENLERQLFGELEQNKALLGENKALRLEAQAADGALSNSEHELLGTRERLGILDQDSRRLQVLSEEQSAHLAELTVLYKDQGVAAEADRERLRAIEAQLLAETAARERAETQLDVETGSYRSERAALNIKLEALTNRAATAEQLLAHARNLVREKDEAHRSAERNLREAVIARTTAERRVEGLQADVERQGERFLEVQRIRTEVDARCAMLTKALAAKDAAVEQSNLRNASLNDRIEEMTRRHELVRAELELGNRRSMEELENERSERTLIQGALEIARESRVSLQKQHDALKRSGRGWRETAMSEHEQEAGLASETDNVRPFAPSGRST